MKLSTMILFACVLSIRPALAFEAGAGQKPVVTVTGTGEAKGEDDAKYFARKDAQHQCLDRVDAAGVLQIGEFEVYAYRPYGTGIERHHASASFQCLGKD